MNYTGEISAVAAVLVWSFSAMIIASAAKRQGAMLINVSRLFIAALLLFITILIFRIPVDVSRNQAVYLAVSGIIGLFFGDTFLLKAFETIGARLSMLIMSISPAMAAIMAYFVFDERLSAWGITGMIITIAGIVLVVAEKHDPDEGPHPITRFGLICALLGALGQAGGLIFARMAYEEGTIHGLIASWIRISVSVMALIPALLILRRLKNPITAFRNDPKSLRLTALGAFMGSYLGITFSLIAIEYTQVGIAATIMATVPIFMLAPAKFFLKEKINTAAVVGSFIAVAGVTLLFIK